MNGTNATANGGIGDDTISSVNVFNGVVEGGAGNDDISFTPLRPSDALTGDEEEDTSRVDGGAGNDTILAGGYGGEVFGGAGDDEIFAQGPMDLVDGGAGNDNISYDSSVMAHIDSVAIPTAAGNAQNWNTAFNGGVVTSFGNIANTPAEDGAVDGSSIST